MNYRFDDQVTRRDFLKITGGLCVRIGVPAIFLAACKPQPVPTNTASPFPTPTAEPSPINTTTPGETAAQIDPDFEPAYLQLHKTGELENRAQKLWDIMESCRLCPRQCGVNRHAREIGFCHSPGTTLVVAAFNPHYGEERPLVGIGGSGTIFLTHCNLRCVFCQNWQISQQGMGRNTDVDNLAMMMLWLQEIGCHNINLVTPTHYSAPILQALAIAAEAGLRLPIVYNTSGWERLEILEILDGIVDIYLPDFKYWDKEMAAKYSSGADSYPELTKAAILEMHRQVGVAKPPKSGIMQRGLMIRHLVMPNDVAGSERIMEWIAGNLPKDTYINIMGQYSPHYKAFDYPQISRRITKDEYTQVVNKAQELGLTNLDIQGFGWLRDSPLIKR